MTNTRGLIAMTTEPNEVLDTGAAARFLGVQRPTLEQWRLRGCGPAYIRVGRLIKYTAADLRAFLAEHRVIPNTANSTQESRVIP